ncbi:MAG: phosphoribosylanthranilate isomerase [Pyrinomonadaceae bacterium]
MTKVKICGITNLEDALLSAKFGADALGFNFYEKSPRYIAPEKAREIIDELPKEILKVGVFVNEDLEKIVKIAKTAKLDALQLHGEETPEFARQLKQKTNLEIIKAFRVSPEFKPEEVLQYETDAILLDAYSPKEHGGTGETFDWEIAKKVQEIFPKMYLAGGLSGENILNAIEKVKPFAVDACSCLEQEKGKKNREKTQIFISIAKSRINVKLITFEILVKKYFHFLETDFGFKLTNAETNYNSSSVRYESNKVFVKPWYFLPQYDYGVSFGLINDENWFSLESLFSLDFGFSKPIEFTFNKLSEIETIEKIVVGFAQLLLENSKEVLTGNEKIYKQIQENEEVQSRSYTENLEIDYSRKQAEIAWQKRNYAKVVKNYQKILESLSPAEIKKLKYSEKFLK